jgi:hypothetical protein
MLMNLDSFVEWCWQEAACAGGSRVLCLRGQQAVCTVPGMHMSARCKRAGENTSDALRCYPVLASDVIGHALHGCSGR